MTSDSEPHHSEMRLKLYGYYKYTVAQGTPITIGAGFGTDKVQQRLRTTLRLKSNRSEPLRTGIDSEFRI